MKEGDEKYLEARRIFEEWERKKILIKDQKPYYYIYEQVTEYGVRKGIIAASDIDETYTLIKRHEKIKSGPIIDRLKLTLATGLNIGLIFTIFKDSNGNVSQYLDHLTEREKPFLDFKWSQKANTGKPAKNSKEIINRLYLVQDPELEIMLRNRILYIADGHHRYQTMIEYKNRMRLLFGHTNGSNENYEKTLLFAAPDKNLIVLGYHRLIKNIKSELLDKFIEKIQDDFFIIKEWNGEILIPEKKGQVGIYFNGKGYLVQVNEVLSRSLEQGNLKTCQKLDSHILQKYIIEKKLRIDESMIRSGDYITYPNGEEEPVKIKAMVDNGSHQVAFILYPTSVQDLMAVADEQEVMPQKSTYFYPKLLTGLVLNQVAPPTTDLSV
jgi:uncharacterized protein (DUF1015 family)